MSITKPHTHTVETMHDDYEDDEDYTPLTALEIKLDTLSSLYRLITNPELSYRWRVSALIRIIDIETELEELGKTTPIADITDFFQNPSK